MPFGFKHGNRSKQALNDPALQESRAPAGASGTASPSYVPSDEERAALEAQAAFNQQRSTEAEPYGAQTIAPDIDPRYQQRSADFPSRSQSTRHPYQPQLAGSSSSNSTDDLALHSRKQLHQKQQGGAQLPSIPAGEQKKSKSIFDRMRSSKHTETKTPPPAQSYNNTAGLARRLSKRQENPPAIRTVQQRLSAEQQSGDWQAAQDSRAQLPSPQEDPEDDSGLDPYLIREPEQASPQSATREREHQRTVRPALSEPTGLSPNDEATRPHFEADQQHSRDHPQYKQSESTSQHYQSSNQSHQPQVSVSSTSLATSDQYRHRNPETVSQLSYESPVDPREDQQRPVSVQSNGQSPTTYPAQRQEYPSRTTSVPQGPRPISQYDMAPPSGAPANRRSGDPKQTLQASQAQGQTGDAPPNYSRGPFSNNQPPTPGLNPSASTVSAQGPGYRGGPPQREYSSIGNGEQGRSTPPPALGDRDVNDAFKELTAKYKKVKGLYFEKTAQVEQLQNTLANQRLSQSRTSLDDSEYMTRFQRLEGATTNLAFNIRKDWRVVPTWLSQSVNQGAMKIGKQEMTAVGRACISKFLIDEIFSRTFHPGLDTDLSTSLKTVEQNIRRFSPALNNTEESDALTAKVVQWRLATLEGLKEILSSPESEEHKKEFSRMATTNLTASLINFLQEPAPAGIEESAHMIVELAVSIASNLPLESRDISIMYPMPGELLQPSVMKVESQIPPLETPGAETADADAASTGSGDKDEKEADKSSDGKLRKEKPKSGMLSGLMGNSSSAGKKPVAAAETSSEGKKIPAEDGAQKVRFAGFVGVEVRGRQVLVKAPVWTL